MRYVDLDKNTVYDTSSMRAIYEEFKYGYELIFGIYMSEDKRYFRVTSVYDDGGNITRHYTIYPATEEYVKRVLADNSIDTYIQEFNPRII